MISVIVPIHNALRFALLTIEALQRHASHEVQIVPVCDCGEEIVPFTLKMLGYDPVVTNYGDYHLAANDGVDHCDGKWVMICNSDMVFSPGWDKPLLKAMGAGLVVASSLHIQRYDGISQGSPEFLKEDSGIWTGPGLPASPDELDWNWFLKVCAKLKKDYAGHWIDGWHFAHTTLLKDDFESIGRFRNMISDSQGPDSMANQLIRMGFSNRVVFDSQVLHFVGTSGQRHEGNDISDIEQWWPWDDKKEFASRCQPPVMKKRRQKAKSKPESLSVLGQKYGTDKFEHEYCSTYAQHLDMIRTTAKKVLEIGIAGGESLRMWRDYFPKAIIFGIDNLESCLIQEDRIQSFLADQSNRNSLKGVLESLGDGFDLIVDDGSHQIMDQLISLGKLFPLLRPGGHYFIEDLVTPSNVTFYNGSGIFATPEELIHSTFEVVKAFQENGKINSPHLQVRETKFLEKYARCVWIGQTGDENSILAGLVRTLSEKESK